MRDVIYLAVQQSRLPSGTSEPHGLLTELASVGALRLLTIDRNHFDVSELANCRGLKEYTQC
jgi:hypothetical protein